MKEFTDKLVEAILANEKDRLDKIMNEVTERISRDFEQVVLTYLDDYYENYDPTKYVRLYGKRGKYLSDKTNDNGISLHAAVSGTHKNHLKRHGFDADNNIYVGGIAFDEEYFKDNNMKHVGKGRSKDGTKFTEWNIIENFVYAGDGVTSDGERLFGDRRSYIAYTAPSLDELMQTYISNYDTTVRKYFDEAVKKYS